MNTFHFVYSLEKKTIIRFCNIKDSFFEIANEFLRHIVFLILRKFIFENIKVTKTWGNFNFMEAFFVDISQIKNL